MHHPTWSERQRQIWTSGERRLREEGEQGSHTSSVVRSGIRDIEAALKWNSAAKEASPGEATRTMKEAIQSCGWRQLWHTTHKKGREKNKKGRKKSTNDARYEGWKKRKGKYVSLQTFLVCSVSHLYRRRRGAVGTATLESATFLVAAPFFFHPSPRLLQVSPSQSSDLAVEENSSAGRLSVGGFRASRCALVLLPVRLSCQAGRHLQKTKAALRKDGRYLSAERRSAFEAGVIETRPVTVDELLSPVSCFCKNQPKLDYAGDEEDFCRCHVLLSIAKLGLINGIRPFNRCSSPSWDGWWCS